MSHEKIIELGAQISTLQQQIKGLAEANKKRDTLAAEVSRLEGEVESLGKLLQAAREQLDKLGPRVDGQKLVLELSRKESELKRLITPQPITYYEAIHAVIEDLTSVGYTRQGGLRYAYFAGRPGEKILGQTFDQMRRDGWLIRSAIRGRYIFGSARSAPDIQAILARVVRAYPSSLTFEDYREQWYSVAFLAELGYLTVSEADRIVSMPPKSFTRLLHELHGMDLQQAAKHFETCLISSGEYDFVLFGAPVARELFAKVQSSPRAIGVHPYSLVEGKLCRNAPQPQAVTVG